MEEMKFIEVLKNVRKKHGDSMKSLAEKVGMSANYINLVENEKRPPSKDLIEKLIEVYKEEKDVLLDSYYIENVPKFIIEQIRNNKIKDMILERVAKKQDFSQIYSEFFEKLSVEDQKVALKILMDRMKELESTKGNFDAEELDRISNKISKL